METTNTVIQSFVPVYAYNIYISGNRRFTARDGMQGIPLEYHGPVKQYAATNYTLQQIDNALNMGWINQQEYDDTIAYKNTIQAV